MKLFFVLGSVFAATAVIFGAFGAHALRATLSPADLATFEVGVRYQMYHALGLIAVAWASTQWDSPAVTAAGWAFVGGIKDHHITLSMSEVGHCGDNAPAEGFFGMIKRERINRRRYLTVTDARADVFDYIERFHNPRIQRRLDARVQQLSVLTHPSAKTG